MARAFWKGSLSFGLVEIPVSLAPAVRADALDFTLLDRSDSSRSIDLMHAKPPLSIRRAGARYQA